MVEDLVESDLHHVDLYVQPVVPQVAHQLLLDLTSVIRLGLPVDQREQPQAAAGPRVLLVQQPGQEQHDAAVSHDPPDVHRGAGRHDL